MQSNRIQYLSTEILVKLIDFVVVINDAPRCNWQSDDQEAEYAGALACCEAVLGVVFDKSMHPRIPHLLCYPTRRDNCRDILKELLRDMWGCGVLLISCERDDGSAAGWEERIKMALVLLWVHDFREGHKFDDLRVRLRVGNKRDALL